MTSPARAGAQALFRLAPSGGEIGTEFHEDRWGYLGDGGAQQGSQQHWIRLPFNGALFSTRVLS